MKYFRIIFGGGNAHLMKLKIKSRKAKALLDENGEVVESEAEPGNDAENENDEKDEIGIDISDCPPGKKISNL